VVKYQVIFLIPVSLDHSIHLAFNHIVPIALLEKYLNTIWKFCHRFTDIYL